MTGSMASMSADMPRLHRTLSVTFPQASEEEIEAHGG